MPIIRVDLLEGRTPEMKENFIAALCEAAADTRSLWPAYAANGQMAKRTRLDTSNRKCDINP